MFAAAGASRTQNNFFLISLAGKTRIKPDESIDQGRFYLHDRCNLFFGIIGDTAEDILRRKVCLNLHNKQLLPEIQGRNQINLSSYTSFLL